MTAPLTVQDGKLVLQGGALGTGAACCCNKCSGPCDAENPCPEGCSCCDGECVAETCCGPCDGENPCGEGCECVDGECVSGGFLCDRWYFEACGVATCPDGTGVIDTEKGVCLVGGEFDEFGSAAGRDYCETELGGVWLQETPPLCEYDTDADCDECNDGIAFAWFCYRKNPDGTVTFVDAGGNDYPEYLPCNNPLP